MLPFLKQLFWSILFDPSAGRTAMIVLLGLVLVAVLVRLLRRWPVLQPLFHALWYDENAARRWFFGFVGFLVTLASMVFVNGVEAAFAWTAKQWAANMVTAMVAMGFTMFNPAGKKKPDGAAQ
jgi:hypothetical protein